MIDGPNLYRYARNAPTHYFDGAGRDPQSEAELARSDDARLSAIGVTRQQVTDYLSMTRGDFISKYGGGTILGEVKFWWHFPSDQVRALPLSLLARLLPATDQTLYLQPSGRIATNSNEKATQVANFDPGTPLGGVASVAARGVAAAVGASRENTELAAGVAGAVGNLANAGLAAPGSASRGIVPARGGAAYGKPNTYEVNTEAPSGGSVGAARANDPTVFEPPGQSIDIRRPDSEALEMQAQWSGQPYRYEGGSIIVREYRIDDVNFDRVTFDKQGYLESLDEFKWDYSGSIASGKRGVAESLVDQATEQLNVADRLGVRLDWHVQRSQVDAFKKVLGKLADKINFIPYDPPKKR
jgi:hypothetical protein